jgi:hypothetical protein
MDTVDSRAMPPLFVNVIAAAGALIVAGTSAHAASPELCAQFHSECTEARAAGYRDVGICHVERLECPADAVEALRACASRRRRARRETRIGWTRSAPTESAT